MYLTGFTDEAGADLDLQIKATKELGWEYIETRKIGDGSLATISDAEFDQVCAKLDESGVKFNCFGSAIGNWATSITESPQSSYDEMKNVGPRMNKLGIKMIRIMSFPVPKEELADNEKYAEETFKRIREVVRIAADFDIICVHENCSGWAGLSYQHTLRMLEAVDSPHLKLVFDTGNPVFEPNVVDGKIGAQDAWEFYKAVKDHIIYVHIKDGRKEGDKTVWTFAGEGDGYVKEIVTDIIKSGYDGGFSMEPHMKVVAHDSSVTSEAQAQYDNYIEYGRRFEKLLEEAKNS